MKISELSRRSGVAVPSIKFYIREGLLPAGEHTAKNQARYTELHLELLDLIRTLKDDLGMSVATIASVLAADPTRGQDFVSDGLSAVAAGSSPKRAAARESAEHRRAVGMVRQVVKDMGWQCADGDPRIDDAGDAIATVLRVWPFELPDGVLVPYAEAAARLAAFEIPDDWDPDQDSVSAFKYAVLGTYLFEPVLLALRRIAHAARSAEVAQKNRAVAKKRPLRPGTDAGTAKARARGKRR
jgi:DNA-binding transcriptional MerR regulator